MRTLPTPTAVRLQPAWDDPAGVRSIIESAGPFWPLARYARNDAELAALGSERTSTFVPPWFRQDFALGGRALVEGAEVMLHNRHFIDAAHRVYGADAIVRPTTVYVNLMGATPFPFVPHTDVPAFRGITRVDHPLWLLQQMQASGLFEQWRIRIVTAVSWFWEGQGGEFHYWPDGPDGEQKVERPPFRDVAIVADNEVTYHGVAPVDVAGPAMPAGLDIHAQLVRDGDGWSALDGGSTVAHYPLGSMRTTVSWKADIFADEADAERWDTHADDLTLDQVVDTFLADLHGRGIIADRPGDPLHDPEWVSVISTTYKPRAPRLVA